MNKITFPLTPRMQGPTVGDLQEALQFLLKATFDGVTPAAYRPLDPPNSPTRQELEALLETLRAEREQTLYGEATQRLVLFFQLQNSLGDNLRGAVEEKTAAKLNEWLKNLGLLDIPEPVGFVVRGTVKTSDGQPVSDANVYAYDRDLRKEQPLGEKAETDAQGQYTIRYGLKDFALGDVPAALAPKLIVRAFVGDLQIGQGVSRPRPTRDEVVNFEIPAPVLSEWDRVSTSVMPLLQGQGVENQALPPGEINDRDLDFIAEETGLEREKIRLWALAFAVSRDAEAAQIFYGWFRQGLPLDYTAVLERPTRELIAAIRKSIEANFVSRTLSDQLEELESTLNRLRAARSLEPAPEGKRASLGDVLGTLSGKEALSDDQRLIFARLHDEHGDTDDLWTQAKLSGLSKTIPALKRTLALDKLTVGHAPVVHALQTKSDAERPESIEFVTLLDPTDWIELVFEHGVPHGSGLDRNGYIEKLQADVEGRFPTQMLSKQLEKQLSASERFPTRDILHFLKTNPDFDVQTQHVEPYLIAMDNGDDSLREGLLQLQRIHVLTANAHDTGVLLDAGFGSATQIINMGKLAFELKVTDRLSPERAGEVFVAAEHTVIAMLALAPVLFSAIMPGNTVAVIPELQASQTTLEAYPSLRALFGDLDSCECRHCQSVLGPAAYLADLLHFLQRSNLTASGSFSLAHNERNSYLEYAAGGTVLGALLQRRPDLADLEFSCENTDTKIPYIDLVLEILENAVALPLLVDPSAYAGKDIKAEFTGGTIPEAVVKALHKTSINVGKTLTATPDNHLGSSSPVLIWIITDGSRRWLVQYRKLQLVILSPENYQVSDVAGGVDSLEHGMLNAEIKDRLSQAPLPLYGAPQIQEVPTGTADRAWTVSYTRAVAIRTAILSATIPGIPSSFSLGTFELLRLDGTSFDPPNTEQLSAITIQYINDAFTSGATTKINAYVAVLLKLPVNETYLQTYNDDKKWWELSITSTATLTHLLEQLSVAGLTYQNSSIHEHLESAPENRNPAAYEMLSKDAVFPWALPFDLWLEETRAFLDALGVPRADLIELARPPQARLSDEAGALELLGLSKSEADLIAPATASTEPWIYWGLAQTDNTVQDHTAGLPWKGSWLEVLAHLSMLLQQSGLSYREYLDLRQTRFVGQVKGTLSPWTPEGVLTPSDPCKTSNIVLTDLDATDFEGHLNRVHLFTRLWRKSGWSMRDLDLALVALGGLMPPLASPHHSRSTTLQQLALLKRLSAEVGLPVSVLLGCIDQLGTQAWTNHIKEGTPIEPALYNSVFQRQTLRSLSDFDYFSLDKIDKGASTTAEKISEHADFVGASLGVKPEQVKAWLAGTPSLGIADAVTLDSLSRLYTAAALCRALRVAPASLPDIVILLGTAADPFFSSSSTRAEAARKRAPAMLEFVERVNVVRKSGISFETLTYVLRHRMLPGKGSDATRIEQELTQILTELRSALRSGVDLGLLFTQLSVSLGLDQQVVARLLDVVVVNAHSAKDLLTESSFLLSDSKSLVERNSWHSQFAALELLSKIVSIGNSLAIQPDQWDWVLSSPFTIMDIRKLPTSTASAAVGFDEWRQFVDLFHLRDVLSDGPARLFNIATALKTSDFATVRKEFAAAFELSETDVIGACSSDLLAFTSGGPDGDYNNPSRLLQLAQLLHVIKALGTTAANITQLTNSAPGESVAQLARNLFAASIDPSALSERLRPISNRLRQLQRDALVTYLINHDHLENSNELFDRYLIDVEMGSCMLTSRIKQAISSVQLFVQRCLLNLERPVHAGEPGVSPISIDSRRWQWMKYYRVWEANRKVFLYPENWIEPELREDKSEIFQALESDLLQSEVTHDTALVSFRKYLDMLSDVAPLTVVSMYDEQVDNATLVHVVGRDNSQPYKYYYRLWRLRVNDDYGTWTPWEEISSQIESGHVVVFVHAGDVHLAWPSFSKNDSEVRWTVSMNLARRNTSGWTKLKKGRGELSCAMLPNKNESRTFAFRFVPPLPIINPVNPAAIDCYAATENGVTPRSPESQFQVTGTSDPQERSLTLNVRILSKLKDSSGAVFFFKESDSNFVRSVTAILYYYLPLLGKFSVISIRLEETDGVYSYHSQLLKDWPGVPPGSTFLGIILVATVSNWGYEKTSLQSEYQSLDKNANWNIDFIFVLDETKHAAINDKYLGIYRGLTLSPVGRFQLTDDDSFTLKPANSAPDLEWPPSYSEHFDSGYLDVPDFPVDAGGGGGVRDHALLIGGSRIPGTPGAFFSLHTARVSSQEFWAYRDDPMHLLLWRKSPTQQYRLVPMDVMGTTALRRELAKGDLTSAVRLPETITKSIAATDVDETYSILKSSIGFENLPASSYYWEVFFHNPLLIATQLSQAQRFEEAQRWFHLIFDPTINDAAPESIRYWRFLPFRKAGMGNSIDELLHDFAQGKDVAPPKFTLKDAINEWAENPFRPHLIAKHRLRSYQFAVVQKYLVNLIAWGDQLFRRDTIEAINEATQLYVLAAKILGKRPASSPKSEQVPKSYRDIQSKLDDFSNWLPLEAIIASQSSSSFRMSPDKSDQPSIRLLNSVQSVYFCIPTNEKLSSYWDDVEDRLFKIRHCMNIEGIERQLPLFEPPIDPALLVRATAAGLDVAAVFSDLQARLPLYRFNVVLQKALEMCGEVKALGNALLSALEKKDVEQLSLLRSSHEIHMLKLVRVIKVQQQEESETNLEALRKTREITLQRYLNYQRLLGKQNVVRPAEGSAAALESSSLMLAPTGAGGGDTQGLALIPAEAGQLGWLNDANNFSIAAGIFNALGGVSHLIPDTQFHFPFTSVEYGGSHIGAALNSMGSVCSILASNASFQANRSSIMGGHQRRYDEWRFQSNTAAKELEQIDKQILANEIRIQIAECEIANHDQQVANTHEVDAFMRGKFTNQQLYSWMVGQISGVYFRTYQLAHDMSKRAERAYCFELGVKDKDAGFIDFGYWDSLKKGLLSGERLYHDLKRMEVAYLDQNKREYEITKHVSLLQLDPLALLRLKETAQCEVSLPESLFDLDFPGHYLRRIKSVSLTIPCVTGPYTSMPCTLTLLKHSVRHDSNASGTYARDVENDDLRFSDIFGGTQSIVTSSAQNDSGMFETNLRDERYLPFEGAGVISSWRLELPKQFQSFDYGTISDVVLHVRYTAREGGSLLKERASTELQTALNEFMRSAGENGLAQGFSLRHEFPTEWYRFLNPADSEDKLTLQFDLKQERFPFPFRAKKIQISKIELFLKLTNEKDPASVKTYTEEYAGGTKLNITLSPPGPPAVALASDPDLAGIPHRVVALENRIPVPVTFKLEASDADIAAIAKQLWHTVTADGTPHYRLKSEVFEDIFILCHYSVTG